MNAAMVVSSLIFFKIYFFALGLKFIKFGVVLLDS